MQEILEPIILIYDKRLLKSERLISCLVSNENALKVSCLSEKCKEDFNSININDKKKEFCNKLLDIQTTYFEEDKVKTLIQICMQAHGEVLAYLLGKKGAIDINDIENIKQSIEKNNLQKEATFLDHEAVRELKAVLDEVLGGTLGKK